MSALEDLVKAVQDASCIASFFCTNLNAALKAGFISRVERQTSIVRAMCLLPEGYTYDQVDRALTRTSIDPDTLCMVLSSGEICIMLMRFYLALTEEQS